jgi:hypothetical protein
MHNQMYEPNKVHELALPTCVLHIVQKFWSPSILQSCIIHLPFVIFFVYIFVPFYPTSSSIIIKDAFSEDMSDDQLKYERDSTWRLIWSFKVEGHLKYFL